jgi:ParB-like chromosome segregation protein Spo0J
MSAPKRGLGRGLDALLPGGAEPAVRTLPLVKLHANRRQPRQRFSDPELDELASSIRTQGVIQPLVVSADGDGTFTIVAGERRFRAARRAVAEGHSARDLERLCAESTAPRARRAKAPPEPNAAAAAERLTQKLQTRVEIVRRGRGGTVRIHFHSEEELMRLYELLILRGGRS